MIADSVEDGVEREESARLNRGISDDANAELRQLAQEIHTHHPEEVRISVVNCS